jgi:hypothetical protein
MQEYLLDGKAIRFALAATIPFIMMISSCEYYWLAVIVGQGDETILGTQSFVCSSFPPCGRC